LVQIPEGFTKEYIAQQRERLNRNRKNFPLPLQEFMHKVECCIKCERLVKSRSLYAYGKPTFGYGNPRSFVVLIGQSPGWRGCGTTGFPFEPLSRTGKVFEDCLKAANLTFEDVYTTNLVKCCPKGSETPTKFEVKNCSPYCVHEINLIKPYALIAVGRLASNFLVRNKMYRKYSCYTIQHPGYILRKGFGLNEYIFNTANLLDNLKKRAMQQQGISYWIGFKK